MHMPQTGFAPKELFDQMLQYMPIPTFDLVLQHGNKGVIVLKRTIAPYKNVWALPGLRMLKGESIDDTLRRIAQQEVGINIDPTQKQFIGQFVGKFSTENNRQDISTCYAICVPDTQEIVVNKDHFSDMKIVNNIPQPIGAMYKYYLQKYFDK